MTDLATWLLACVDEDSRVGEEAKRMLADHGEQMDGGWNLWGKFGRLVAQIADVDRWLAECDTKRRIIAAWVDAEKESGRIPVGSEPDDYVAKRRIAHAFQDADHVASERLGSHGSAETDDEVAHRLTLEWVVKILALPYASYRGDPSS